MMAFKNSLVFSMVCLVCGFTGVSAQETRSGEKKNQVMDFSAGYIEGELNRPSMLMELGTNFKDFNDLLLQREDFNSYHEVDSSKRLRYFEENK